MLEDQTTLSLTFRFFFFQLGADSRYNVSEVEDSNQGRLNFTLQIAFVDWEDAGNYTCLASRTTALSDNASKTIEVIVRGTTSTFALKKWGSGWEGYFNLPFYKSLLQLWVFYVKHLFGCTRLN